MARKQKKTEGTSVSKIQNPQLQLRTVPGKGRPASSDISPKLERQWLAFDRRSVLDEIERVRSAIDDSATELKMVAVEGVFEESLSQQLLRTTEEMAVLKRELRTLRNLVTRAGGPPKKKGPAR